MRDKILMIDGLHGVHVPEYFADDVNRSCLYNVEESDLDTLAHGHDSDPELYWEVWHDVLDRAQLVENDTLYALYQDGDLWSVKMGEIVEAPAHWAPALINADYSGIEDDEECERVSAFERDQNGPIVDTLEDEPYFRNNAPLEAPGELAGDYLRYIVSTPHIDDMEE